MHLHGTKAKHVEITLKGAYYNKDYATLAIQSLTLMMNRMDISDVNLGVKGNVILQRIANTSDVQAARKNMESSNFILDVAQKEEKEKDDLMLRNQHLFREYDIKSKRCAELETKNVGLEQRIKDLEKALQLVIPKSSTLARVVMQIIRSGMIDRENSPPTFVQDVHKEIEYSVEATRAQFYQKMMNQKNLLFKIRRILKRKKRDMVKIVLYHLNEKVDEKLVGIKLFIHCF